MYITENAAYIKGLAEGLGISESTPEGKVITKLIDLVEQMTAKIQALEDENDFLSESVELLESNITEIEDYLYDYEDEEYEDYSDLNDEEEYDEEFEDEDYYEIECPSCGEVICFSEDIDLETLVCPACGEPITDIEIVEEDMCDNCDGCDATDNDECTGDCDGCTKN
ncbi:MAG: hypothetical protein IKU99_04805 [Clostridia bacterium]|nr:hypothetical protein [Clostridia bacterium]